MLLASVIVAPPPFGGAALLQLNFDLWLICRGHLCLTLPTLSLAARALVGLPLQPTSSDRFTDARSPFRPALCLVYTRSCGLPFEPLRASTGWACRTHPETLASLPLLIEYPALALSIDPV